MISPKVLQKLFDVETSEWDDILTNAGISWEFLLTDENARSLWKSSSDVHTTRLAAILDHIPPPTTVDEAISWCCNHQVDAIFLIASDDPKWVRWGVELSGPDDDPRFMHRNALHFAYLWSAAKFDVLLNNSKWCHELGKADLSRLFGRPKTQTSEIAEIVKKLVDHHALSERSLSWGLEWSLINSNQEVFSILAPHASKRILEDLATFSWAYSYVGDDVDKSTKMLLSVVKHKKSWDLELAALGNEHTTHIHRLTQGGHRPPNHILQLRHFPLAQVLGQLVAHDQVTLSQAIRTIFLPMVSSSMVPASVLQEWMSTYLTTPQHKEIVEFLPKLKNVLAKNHHPKLNKIFEHAILTHEVEHLSTKTSPRSKM